MATHPTINIQSIFDYYRATSGKGHQKRFVTKDYPCIKPPFKECRMIFVDSRPNESGICLNKMLEVVTRQYGDTVAMTLGDHGVNDPYFMAKVITNETGMPMSPMHLKERDTSAYYWIPWDRLGCSLQDRLLLDSMAHFCVAMMAICFMHAKGSVITEPTFPTRQLRRAHKRSGDVYKVLKVEALDRIERERRASSGSRSSRAHLVRGHFKDCREHGIAGNPNAKGIYWWQPAIRGSVKKGFVTKDYEVAF